MPKIKRRPEIKPCPRCHKLPAECECPPGERWIALGGLMLHLAVDFVGKRVVDVRVFAETTEADLKRAYPTINAWAERCYQDAAPRPGDLVAEFDARHRAGESWRDLALVVDRRLAGYLDRMQRGSLTEGAARTFAWHDLRQVGVGDDLALKTVNELIEAVQRGEKPFDDRYPVVDRETIQQTVKRWRAHHTT